MRVTKIPCDKRKKFKQKTTKTRNARDKTTSNEYNEDSQIIKSIFYSCSQTKNTPVINNGENNRIPFIRKHNYSQQVRFKEESHAEINQNGEKCENTLASNGPKNAEFTSNILIYKKNNTASATAKSLLPHTFRGSQNFNKKTIMSEFCEETKNNNENSTFSKANIQNKLQVNEHFSMLQMNKKEKLQEEDDTLLHGHEIQKEETVKENSFLSLTTLQNWDALCYSKSSELISGKAVLGNLRSLNGKTHEVTRSVVGHNEAKAKLCNERQRCKEENYHTSALGISKKATEKQDHGVTFVSAPKPSCQVQRDISLEDSLIGFRINDEMKQERGESRAPSVSEKQVNAKKSNEYELPFYENRDNQVSFQEIDSTEEMFSYGINEKGNNETDGRFFQIESEILLHDSIISDCQTTRKKRKTSNQSRFVHVGRNKLQKTGLKNEKMILENVHSNKQIKKSFSLRNKSSKLKNNQMALNSSEEKYLLKLDVEPKNCSGSESMLQGNNVSEEKYKNKRKGIKKQGKFKKSYSVNEKADLCDIIQNIARQNNCNNEIKKCRSKTFESSSSKLFFSQGELSQRKKVDLEDYGYISQKRRYPYCDSQLSNLKDETSTADSTRCATEKIEEGLKSISPLRVKIKLLQNNVVFRECTLKRPILRRKTKANDELKESSHLVRNKKQSSHFLISSHHEEELKDTFTSYNSGEMLKAQPEDCSNLRNMEDNSPYSHRNLGDTYQPNTELKEMDEIFDSSSEKIDKISAGCTDKFNEDGQPSTIPKLRKLPNNDKWKTASKIKMVCNQKRNPKGCLKIKQYPLKNHNHDNTLIGGNPLSSEFIRNSNSTTQFIGNWPKEENENECELKANKCIHSDFGNILLKLSTKNENLQECRDIRVMNNSLNQGTKLFSLDGKKSYLDMTNIKRKFDNRNFKTIDLKTNGNMKTYIEIDTQMVDSSQSFATENNREAHISHNHQISNFSGNALLLQDSTQYPELDGNNDTSEINTLKENVITYTDKTSGINKSAKEKKKSNKTNKHCVKKYNTEAKSHQKINSFQGQVLKKQQFLENQRKESVCNSETVCKKDLKDEKAKTMEQSKFLKYPRHFGMEEEKTVFKEGSFRNSKQDHALFNNVPHSNDLGYTSLLDMHEKKLVVKSNHRKNKECSKTVGFEQEDIFIETKNETEKNNDLFWAEYSSILDNKTQAAQDSSNYDSCKSEIENDLSISLSSSDSINKRKEKLHDTIEVSECSELNFTEINGNHELFPEIFPLVGKQDSPANSWSGANVSKLLHESNSLNAATRDLVCAASGMNEVKQLIETKENEIKSLRHQLEKYESNELHKILDHVISEVEQTNIAEISSASAIVKILLSYAEENNLNEVSVKVSYP